MILRATMIGLPLRTGTEAADLSGRISHAAGREVRPEDVHVRRFLAANSRPSKDGFLRIRESAIRKLAKLYTGAPVMRNHGLYGSEDMPLGTVFDASTRTADDKATELVLDYYTAKGDPLGDMAAKYVDLGIWKESSIHAMFAEASCSICDRSMDPEDKDFCDEHEPGEKYGDTMARIELDRPLEAPEFSLCWSGRLAGTRALSREVPEALTLGQFMTQRKSWLQALRAGLRMTTVGTAPGSWFGAIKTA